jgi:hypothetical protein
MYVVMDAHPLTVIIIVGALMVTPIYVFATYVFSGASCQKGLRVGMTSLVIGAFMFWVCLSGLSIRLGLPGSLIVPAMWILPSLALFLWRKWFLSERLSQKWLVGLQFFRAIGALFLLEMVRGYIPGIFAYPAGIGDILVAVVALAVLVRYLGSPPIPGGAVTLVIIVGVTDFLSAFFFGFFSSKTPLQLFFPAVANNVIVFPTGLIPLFLVPYAIFFHVLSGLNYVMHEKALVGGPRQPGRVGTAHLNRLA